MERSRNSRTARDAGMRLPVIVTASLFLFLGIGVSESSAQLFGDGSDGAHTVAGTEHLTENKDYTDLTVPAGTILETHGFTVRVNGTLNNAGTITDSYSGGTGGVGGIYGVGGTTGPGQPGTDGDPGLAGSSGAGFGGNGGGGGGGGGGAEDTDDNEFAQGGRGGRGGDGGQGGGRVTIFCRELNNTGVIHANGFDGSPGQSGLTGDYNSYAEIFGSRDLAGGGGGGGAGGNGGDGGTVSITYQTPTVIGSVTANGGVPGGPGFGASGTPTSEPPGGNTNAYLGGNGATFDSDGGNGGRGEIDDVSSLPGDNGNPGEVGATGSVNLTPSTVCYVDADGDGYGDALDTGTDVAGGCSAGFSTNNLDCDDTDPSINPGAGEIPDDGIDQDCDGLDAVTCYVDADADGYGDANDPGTIVSGSCGSGFVDNNFDCDDTDPDINPGADDIPNDHIDQNCDGFDDIICYVDADGDGYGDAGDTGTEVVQSCGSGFADNNLDCDDTDPGINPDVTEIPGDGIDQDCDGLDASLCYLDSDADGYGDAGDPGTLIPGSCVSGFADNNSDCDDTDPDINPDATEIPFDGIDQDCDGQDAVMCYVDADGDGYGDAGDPGTLTPGTCGSGFATSNSDCDDTDPDVNPGQTEIPGDGIDQDCDGQDAVICYTDADADGYGDLNDAGKLSPGTCGSGTVENNLDCDDTDPDISPDGTEIPNDGIDQDCDGQDLTGCCIPPTVGDCDQNGIVDISDISILIDNQFLTLTPLVCEQEGDADISGVVDITDVSILIDNQFLTLTPLPACP